MLLPPKLRATRRTAHVRQRKRVEASLHVLSASRGRALNSSARRSPSPKSASETQSPAESVQNRNSGKVARLSSASAKSSRARSPIVISWRASSVLQTTRTRRTQQKKKVCVLHLPLRAHTSNRPSAQLA